MKKGNHWDSSAIHHRLACGSLLGLSALFAGNAHGQAAAPQEAPAESPPPAAEAVVVVTGSRIARRDYVSASPIVTTSKELIQESGNLTLEATLNTLPQFTPAGNANGGGQGAGARATVDMRGLGDNRNLVLLDGRRLPLSSAFGQVNIDIIPQAIVDNVETISGGASAVYGSDAISGVVNFKTGRKLKGVVLDAQYGNSQHADARRRSLSVTGGGDFANGRGYALIALSDDERAALPGTARPFFYGGVPSSFIGTGTYAPSAANLPTQAAVNAVFSRYGVSTVVPRTDNLGFNDNGSLFGQTGPVNYGGAYGTAYAVAGGGLRMPVLIQSDLINQLQRHSVFNKLEFRFTPDLTGYTQFLHSNSVTQTNAGSSLTLQFNGSAITVPTTNPFVPADLQTILASRPNPAAPFALNSRFVGIPNRKWDEQYNTDQLIVGLRGNVPFRDWTFDSYVSVDKLTHTQAMLNAVLATRVQTLLNAADGGKSLCAGGFNPFGTANAMAISAACRDYMTATVTSTEDVGQRIAEASVQGSLAELPAGDLQFSASANYRKNTYNFTPDAQQLATNVLSVGGALRSSGSTAVKEAAGELRVPLLKDAPLAKALATSLGYRLSDYDHAGRQSTYKVDLEWTPLDNVLVRGGLQHAIRAPNVGELFSATVAGQFNFGTPPVGGEPCDVRGAGRTGANAASLRALCLATGVPASVIDSYTYPTTAAGAFSSGNVNLRPEVANTRTIGLVLTPRFAAPLFNQVSLSVDYYNIKIADTISAVPAAAALNKCYNMDGSNPSYSPSNPFCQLIVRDANGLLNQVNAPFLNLGKLQTAGVDLQLDWRFKLSALGMAADAGSFGINTAANVMNSYRAQALPGDALQEFRGTVGTVVRPRWQSVTTFRYEFGSGSVALRWRHLPAMRDITAVTRPASPTAGVARYDIADLSGHVGLGEHTDLRFGITNLFNRDPNLVPGSQNLTLPATYDIVGRSYFVGLREKF